MKQSNRSWGTRGKARQGRRGCLELVVLHAAHTVLATWVYASRSGVLNLLLDSVPLRSIRSPVPVDRTSSRKAPAAEARAPDVRELSVTVETRDPDEVDVRGNLVLTTLDVELRARWVGLGILRRAVQSEDLNTNQLGKQRSSGQFTISSLRDDTKTHVLTLLDLRWNLDGPRSTLLDKLVGGPLAIVPTLLVDLEPLGLVGPEVLAVSIAICHHYGDWANVVLRPLIGYG